MLMDEDGSENNQVKVATLLVSVILMLAEPRGYKGFLPFYKRGKGEEGKTWGRKRREENGADSEEKKKETEDGEQERETQRGAGE